MNTRQEQIKLSKIELLLNKFEVAYRLLFLNYFSRYISVYLITEYPKSGGTWLSQLISEYMNIPFPRNTFPKLKNSIFHGHYSPNRNLNNCEKIFLLVRDGRDVIVSLYFHLLLWNEKNKQRPKEVIYYRNKLRFKDYENVKKNLTGFIEFVFQHTPPKRHRFTYHGNWAHFNERWLSQEGIEQNKIICVKYEDLLNDTESEMRRILFDLKIKTIDEKKLSKTIDTFSFQTQTKRKRGEERKGSFLRKGIVGDWKNYFNKKSAEVFNDFAGDLLIRLGYEKDRMWVKNM